MLARYSDARLPTPHGEFRIVVYRTGKPGGAGATAVGVAEEEHVAMVLGEQAYDRGAWANRIGESEPGVGYLFGEGVREPLRVRAGWVPDHVIKELEAFVSAPALPSPRPAFELSPVPSSVGSPL